MTRKVWVIAGCSVGLLLMIAIVSLWSNADVNKAERREEAQKAAAEQAEDAAAEIEKKQNEQKAKIEYLEGEIETLRNEARRKDEELKRLGVDVRVARDRVERAKRTRTIDADADELCRKLESLGHGCEK
ncbi:MAG: hypothetical protein K1X52_05540 [Pyrinomonadaceae bacterium]|nr:hypothetical protein [Pyrinomonadaceae bacterium]